MRKRSIVDELCVVGSVRRWAPTHSISCTTRYTVEAGCVSIDARLCVRVGSSFILVRRPFGSGKRALCRECRFFVRRPFGSDKRCDSRARKKPTCVLAYLCACWECLISVVVRSVVINGGIKTTYTTRSLTLARRAAFLFDHGKFDKWFYPFLICQLLQCAGALPFPIRLVQKRRGSQLYTLHF